MTPKDLPEAEAEVDVCHACGGLWVDWFDGEVRKIATETLRVSAADLDADHPPASRQEAIGACPRCSKHLVTERYSVVASVTRDTGKVSLIPKETGAELLRCEDCMGAFVSRPNAEILAFLDAADAPPPSRGPASLRPLPWNRFVKVVKGFIGLKG